MGQCVGPIIAPGDLGDCKVSPKDFLLQPELLNVEMAYLPDSLPHDHASGGGGISLQLEVRVVPKILGDALGAETLLGSL